MIETSMVLVKMNFLILCQNNTDLYDFIIYLCYMLSNIFLIRLCVIWNKKRENFNEFQI